ncbi:hypothetical protein BCR33DRAFT_714001 [Rhizoclosmatium globosum]|uniref:Uncharacterized protein n=1 Tax=Rhizoclosmatium globosum TaxID=329046 RepID=A0A1Y2CPD1_9FUNG|nr:hypothetical protein BCR33DRAFT_714001 [Rhizoclosmatium globosum]|eukprot:ORY48888.1 hypothetical protein BCR33DRAFT_714001 [Rhizoclosmatium globosum]
MDHVAIGMRSPSSPAPPSPASLPSSPFLHVNNSQSPNDFLHILSAKSKMTREGRLYTPESEILTDTEDCGRSLQSKSDNSVNQVPAQDIAFMWEGTPFAQKTTKQENIPFNLLPPKVKKFVRCLQTNKSHSKRTTIKKTSLCQASIQDVTYDSISMLCNIPWTIHHFVNQPDINIPADLESSLARFIHTQEHTDLVFGSDLLSDWRVEVRYEKCMGWIIKIWSQVTFKLELMVVMVRKIDFSSMTDEDKPSHKLSLVLMNGNLYLQQAVTKWIEFELLTSLQRVSFTPDHMRSILEALVLGMDIKLKPHLAIVDDGGEMILSMEELEQIQTRVFQTSPSDPGFCHNQAIICQNSPTVIKTNYAFVSNDGTVQFIGGIPLKIFKVLLSLLSNVGSG